MKHHLIGPLAALSVAVLILLSGLMWDRPVALYFHHATEWRPLFSFITRLGESWIYLTAAALVWVSHRYDQAVRRGAALLFGSVALSGLLAVVLKIAIGRLRPKLLFEQQMYGFDHWRIGYEYASFPSGHTTTAFAAMTTLALLFPRYRYAFIAVAVAVALSRVVLTAHFVADVLGGALLGSITAWWLHRRFFQPKETA